MKKFLTYELNREEGGQGKRGISSAIESLKEFLYFMKGDELKLAFSFILIIINSISTVLTPFLIALAIDKYVSRGDITGLGKILIYLTLLYIVTLFVGYAQSRLVGGISQRTLYKLREALFKKLQELPISFFNQNKAGDLISRLNNDTDKISQFLGEGISRFVGIFFSVFGIALFVLLINTELALVMLSSVAFLIIITRILSPWIERKNKTNLVAVGALSASLQENIANFRVIVAYSKRDYLKSHLEEMNKNTFDTAFISGVANRVFEPIYDFAGNLALIAVLSYGLYQISVESLTLGLLVAFISYTQKFYDPLRTLATIFGTIQLSAAAWSRIREVLSLQNNLRMEISPEASKTGPSLRLENVSFKYEGGDMVIENASLTFKKGKTYALIGPTGGGKSTLANLISHLYDPVSGSIVLNEKEIWKYSHKERAKEISVILQDPVLFAGSVADNIRYGNEKIENLDDNDLGDLLKEKGFLDVIGRFNNGLATEIDSSSGGGLSIGQKQLISFMRAVLREPRILVLDEATANIDTITETILNKTLKALSKDTIKIIIAHRLNTIKDADEIMFVNGHHVTSAGSFADALYLIENAKRRS